MNALHDHRFSVSGMTCSTCAAKVQSRLQEHPSWSEAQVTLNPPEAKITTSQALTEATVNEWLRPLGKYEVHSTASPPVVSSVAASAPPPSAATYRPLILVLSYLLLVIAAIGAAQGSWDSSLMMRLFMGGFFVTFSFFKMLDLAGFAEAYRGYDLVAKAFPFYGRLYPFIELGLGLAYLADWQPFYINLATAIVMAVSLAGVLKAVLSRQTIRCACLGTVFNLPMSTVTIVEDGVMLFMALAALALH